MTRLPAAFPDEQPTLLTARLRLRPHEDRDLPGFFAFHADPIAMRYWSVPPAKSLDDVRPIFDRNSKGFSEKRALSWSVCLLEDDVHIGGCALFNVDCAHRRADVGYGLLRSHWRRGIMREALTAIFAFAFDTMNLHRLEADIDPRNDASIALLESLKFRREGYLRERWFVGDEVADTVLMGRLRTDA